MTNASLLTKKGLKGVRKYADWVAPYKYWIIGRNADNTLAEPSDLVGRAHQVGLSVVI